MSEGMKQADPELIWPKFKVVKSCVMMTSEMHQKVLLPDFRVLERPGIGSRAHPGIDQHSFPQTTDNT
jgi:hypothetical protein